MASVQKVLVISCGVLFCCAIVNSAAVNAVEKKEINEDEALQQGRTFVHHAMKRLAILLPAFMFKLGIMFTMLLVSMITSTKSLLVGTLLLALGVGHFIANRFNTPAPSHAHITLPHIHAGWHAAPHFVDRSDTVTAQNSPTQMVGTIPAAYAQPQAYAQQQAYSAWKQ